MDTPASSLSGGNQQKVVLSKWLDTKPRILILDEPTRGIDVGAKVEVHHLIDELVKEGIAIILISSDLPELLPMSDRILVMREGRQMDIVDGAGATQEEILAQAMGQAEPVPPVRGVERMTDALLRRLRPSQVRELITLADHHRHRRLLLDPDRQLPHRPDLQPRQHRVPHHRRRRRRPAAGGADPQPRPLGRLTGGAGGLVHRLHRHRGPDINPVCSCSSPWAWA